MIKKIILIIFLIIIFKANLVQAGLGISPSKWTEEHALPGSQIQKTFILSRSNPEQDLYFDLELQGEEIKNWLIINNQEELIALKGQTRTPINLALNIPKNTKTGDYPGFLRIKSISQDNQGTAVLLSALIQLNIAVTDEAILDYEILEIYKKNNKKIELNILNKGNVPAKPTKLQITIFDKLKQSQIKSYAIQDLRDIEPVNAFSQDKIIINLNHNLQAGLYWLKADVYHNAELKKSDDIFLEIKKTDFYLIAFIVIIIIIFILVLKILLLWRSRKIKK